MQVAHTAIADAATTVSDTVLELVTDLGFTAAQVNAADSLHIRVVSQAVIWRYTGDDPTAGESYYLGDEQELVLTGNVNLKNFRVLRAASNDAEVFITLAKI